MAAPQEVSLKRGNKVGDYETSQAAVRIKYFHLTHTYAVDERRECSECGHCGARCYLEGLSSRGADSTQAAPARDAQRQPDPGASDTSTIVSELCKLRQLKEDGMVDDVEYKWLRDSVMGKFAHNAPLAKPLMCRACCSQLPCLCSGTPTAPTCPACGDPKPCTCS